VHLFTALEHRQELGQTAFAGLGFFRLGEAVGDRVAVGAIELGEESRGGGVGVELALEVVGNFRRALALVGGLPAAVLLGRRDLGDTRRAEALFDLQRFAFLAVDLRPAPAGDGA